MIKTVLFDLDDTIFDHKQCRLCALNALKTESLLLSEVSLEDLEKEHEILLAGNYKKVLDKTLTLTESMVERTYLLFEKYGIELSEADAQRYTEIYKKTYESSRQAVPGIRELLSTLKNKVKIGVVSNGLYNIQMEKIKLCKAEGFIDFYVFSEDIGARKPDRAIFETALSRSGSKPEEVVYIGDSWESDVVGATNCGIKAVWINRYGMECPDGSLAYEIKSYDNIDDILSFIYAADHIK